MRPAEGIGSCRAAEEKSVRDTVAQSEKQQEQLQFPQENLVEADQALKMHAQLVASSTN